MVRNNPKSVADAAEKAKAQEAWYKIVVKILSWKEGLVGSGTVVARDKVTQKDWKTYSDRIIKNNVSYNKERVLKDLKETKDKIAHYGGFE